MNKNFYNTSNEPCDVEEELKFTDLENFLKQFGNINHDYHKDQFRSRLRVTPRGSSIVARSFSFTLEGYGGSVYCAMIALRKALMEHVFKRCKLHEKNKFK